ncbi:hypothetical protein F5X96DRAFT_668463 [Biscogniauxia mediterranea]|nr:hypothetical protein F5X96DRAFT_668463 [Biscogniauxia mediterranea]
MATFRFDKLPPELRAMVCKYALLQESSNRLVALYHTQVAPTKVLASPFLVSKLMIMIIIQYPEPAQTLQT